MCDPTTIAVIGLAASAAASGASVLQQRANVEAQNEFQRRLHARNAKLAKEQARSGYIALGQRLRQEKEALAAGVEEVTRRARAATGRGVVAAAESGIKGNTVDALLADFQVTKARHVETARRNLEFTQAQFERDAEGIRFGHEASLLRTTPRPNPLPNFGIAMLRIAGATTQGYLSLTEPTPGEGVFGRSVV